MRRLLPPLLLLFPFLSACGGTGSNPDEPQAPPAAQPAAPPVDLTAGLDDRAASVRAAAAFALGQSGDPGAAEALLAHWVDPEPEVRARVVEAAGRIATPALRTRVLSATRSSLEVVRRAAVLAPHAWPTDAPDAQRIDGALAELATQLAQGDERAARFGVPASALESPEVLWRALFTLARRGAEAGRDAFHLHLVDADPRARLFAAKGLAGIEVHDAGRVALEAASKDPDWRVAVEALRGLGTYGDRRSLDALQVALAHQSVNVRIVAAEALGAFTVDSPRVGALLALARGDASPSVRASALVADGALRGARALATLTAGAADSDPVVRGGAALGAGHLPSELAVPLLLRLAADPHPRVAGLAISALAGQRTNAAHARLVALLRGEDNGLRSGAALALRDQARAEDLSALAAGFEASVGDIGADAKVEILRTAATLDTTEARELLARAANDDDSWVGRIARGLGGASTDPEQNAPGPAPRISDPGANPMVVIETTRGPMVFELFPVEAPVHVLNFLSLARAGHYDGLDFHRVVPDFVIQGGCYRGDGNGGGTWRGPADSLGQEFTPRAYVRGSLGMPRGENPDSGGSQFFVTQRATPHLDGRYTIFGELREGLDVLDRIEVGDRIRSVRVR
jgi:cyclophilin family peptidyl-prolyl cis-trans isomerase/HEAT repeat protein